MSKEIRSPHEQGKLNHAYEKGVIGCNPQEVAEALESGADPKRKASTNRSHLFTAAVRKDSKNNAIVDLIYMTGGMLTKPDIKILNRIVSGKGNISEFYKASLPQAPGMQRLLQLESGAITVSPETLLEDYGIEFDLDTHIKNVSQSPFKTASPDIKKWTPPTPAQEVYQDIEELAATLAQPNKPKKIATAKKAVTNFDMDDHLEKTRPRTTLEGGSAEVAMKIAQEDPSRSV